LPTKILSNSELLDAGQACNQIKSSGVASYRLEIAAGLEDIGLGLGTICSRAGLIPMSASQRIRGSFALTTLGITLLATGAPLAPAQFFGGQSSPAPTGDKSALRPPAGARVAIFEFEDMECPDCARANPLLKEAAEKYNIPWLRHDFPLPMHAWSFQAAVNARWFDTKSKKLGDDYRDAVFADQPRIAGTDDLRAYTEKFSNDHKVAFPFAVDPQGKLAAEVKADYALGQRIGVEHTPTIWVVTNRVGNAAPFVEVVDRTKLYDIIDAALASTKPAQATRTTAAVKH
jgi:protein-disulfide isomerase